MTSGGFNDYAEIDAYVKECKEEIKAKIESGELTEEEADTETDGLIEYAEDQEAELAAMGIPKPEPKKSFMDTILGIFTCGSSKKDVKAEVIDPEDYEEEELLDED